MGFYPREMVLKPGFVLSSNKYGVFSPGITRNAYRFIIGRFHGETRRPEISRKSFIQSLRHCACAVTTSTCPAKQYAKNHGLHSKVHDVIMYLLYLIMVNSSKGFARIWGGALSPNRPLNADGDIPKLGQVSPYKFRLDTAPPSPSNDSDQADSGHLRIGPDVNLSAKMCENCRTESI